MSTLTDDQRAVMEGAFWYGSPTFLSANAIRCGVEPFGVDDIADVEAWFLHEGDYAEEDVRALVRLSDGRWAAIDGGCDTTGWDCQAWCDVRVGDDRAAVVAFGFDDEARRVLGLDGEATA